MYKAASGYQGRSVPGAPLIAHFAMSGIPPPDGGPAPTVPSYEGQAWLGLEAGPPAVTAHTL
jgi:hypothetical protein